MNFHSPCCSQCCLIYKDRPLNSVCSTAFMVQSLSYSFKKQYGHACHKSSPLPDYNDFYIHYVSIVIIKYLCQVFYNPFLYTKRVYLDFWIQKTESLFEEKHGSNKWDAEWGFTSWTTNRMQRPDSGMIHSFEMLTPFSSDTPPLTKATFRNPLQKRHQFGVKYSNFEANGEYAHSKHHKALTVLTVHQN